VLIAGDVNLGKTTLLQALLAALPADRRIVTIEDPIEIDLGRPRLEQLEARQPNLQGVGRFTQRDLLRLSLRLRPDHLIVGEVRDGAAWDMVDAMSLGHNGSVATIHAGSPLQALLRLESLCLRAEDAPSLGSVRRAIAESMNLVVQAERVPAVVNGQPMVRRMVTKVVELVGLARSGRTDLSPGPAGRTPRRRTATDGRRGLADPGETNRHRGRTGPGFGCVQLQDVHRGYVAGPPVGTASCRRAGCPLSSERLSVWEPRPWVESLPPCVRS
jgi:hypothetical protein